MNVRIRPARATDLSAMRTIKNEAGLAAWEHILPRPVIEALPLPERWAAAITSSDSRTGVLVAESGARVVGFAITRPSADPDAGASTGELDGFYVDPASWGAGAGHGLLAAATARLRDAGFIDATLWTAEENHRPRRIYATAGWRTDGTDRHRELGGIAFVEVRYRIRISSPVMQNAVGDDGRATARIRGAQPGTSNKRGVSVSHHDKPAAKKPAAKKPAAKKPAVKKK